jgi:hypothetical protein
MNESKESQQYRADAMRWTAALPPYGSVGYCVKCHQVPAWAKYHPEPFIYGEGNAMEFEHIRRECCNCGYSWNERPLDWDGAETKGAE